MTHTASEWWDLSAWRPFQGDVSRLQQMGANEKVQVQPDRLYALFGVVLGLGPNGPFRLSGSTFPLDDPFWWDFLVEKEDAIIHVWRSNLFLEGRALFTAEKISITDFFSRNIQRYGREIGNRLKTFERHQLLQNHVQSYKAIAGFLESDLSKIKPRKPNPITHVVTKKEADRYPQELKAFAEDSARQHFLAKSLILNSAFLVEGYLNSLGTIAGVRNAVLYQRPNSIWQKLLHRCSPKYWRKKYGRRGKELAWKERLRLIHVLTPFFKSAINWDDRRVQEALKLLGERHEYVHSDLVDQTHSLGYVLFDGVYPLHPVTQDSFQVDEISKAYSIPSTDRAMWAAKTAESFIEYLESLFHPSYLEQVRHLFSQNPIGFHKDKNRFSAVSPNTLVMGLAVTSDRGNE